MRRTEDRNPRSEGIESMSPIEIATILADENAVAVSAAVAAAAGLAQAMQLVAESYKTGGATIYVGAGTSARIAASDAAEMPPTFGIHPERFTTLIAGGSLNAAVEGAEDDEETARQDLEALFSRWGFRGHTVIGISASGSTPYTLAAVLAAKNRSVPTVGIANNPGALLLEAADVPILLDTGPEIIAGSTRLKAGTAQKIALNTISTGAMILAGRVKGSAMSHMQPLNRKLRERAVGIVMDAAGVAESEALRRLEAAKWDLPKALSE
jgi:N-acetylmuramic acid 6-phosphate etherase